MKKLTLLFVLFIALASIAYVLQNKESSKMNTDDRKFAYKNIENITKVTISGKEKPMQEFERKGKKWHVNGHLVSDHKINTLLKAISGLTIENIPSPKTNTFIFDSIEKSGIQVKVYSKNRLLRSYTVGPDANSTRCTYMIVDGFDQPYCMTIKGFGTVRLRYTKRDLDWKDTRLFNINSSKEIEKLKVEYHKDYTHSFEINKVKNGYQIDNIGGLSKNDRIDNYRIVNYLNEFENLYGEGYDDQFTQIDSIISLIPFVTISLELSSGENKSLKLWGKNNVDRPNQPLRLYSDAGMIEKYYMYADGKFFMVGQHHLIKSVLRPYNFFVRENM